MHAGVALAIAAFAVLPTGAIAQKVKTDYDHHTDVTKFRTYRMVGADVPDVYCCNRFPIWSIQLMAVSPVSLGSRNRKLLSNLDLVRIVQLIRVRFEDLHVGIGVAIEFLGDLREGIARLHGISLKGGRFCGSGQAGIDREVAG